MGSLGIQGTNHSTPYLQVPLTGAKIACVADTLNLLYRESAN